MALVVLVLSGILITGLTIWLIWALLDLVINIINLRGYYEEYTKHKTISYISKPNSADSRDVIGRL